MRLGKWSCDLMNGSRIRYFVVDAFTNHPFKGNPAAVVPLDHWEDDSWLQKVAMEMNLSETAFLVPNAQGFDLRWFTPKTEVDLCGHATIASSVVLAHLGKLAEGFRFRSLRQARFSFQPKCLCSARLPTWNS